MQLPEILLLIVVYCVGLLIAGYVYSEIWNYRNNRGKFQKGFDKLLSKTEVYDKILKLDKQINDPDFPKKIGKQIWEQTRAEKGGTMKGIYSAGKEELRQLAEVESFQYPNLLRMANELDGLIQAKWINADWGEKFLNLAQNPAWQPRLDKIASGIFKTIDSDGNASSHGAGQSRWL